MKTPTTNELMESLAFCLCPACGLEKKPKRTVCYKCFMRLSPRARSELYRLIGEGYEAAFAQAMKELQVIEIKLPDQKNQGPMTKPRPPRAAATEAALFGKSQRRMV